MKALKIILYILAKIVAGVLAFITLPIWFPLFLVLVAFLLICAYLTDEERYVTIEV